MRKLTFNEMMNILRAMCIYARNIMVHLDFWKVFFLDFQLHFPKELGLFHRTKYSNPNIFAIWSCKPFFKLRLFDPTKFIVWNIKGLWHWVAKLHSLGIRILLILNKANFSVLKCWNLHGFFWCLFKVQKTLKFCKN